MNSGQRTEHPRIVVGVDGFEPSMAALRWAIHQARLTGAVVEAVTAWHVPVGTGWLPAADMPDYQEDAFDVLAEAMAQMYVIDPDVEVCPRVVKGQAGQVLVDAAEGADLLVVGCRGHGGLVGAMLGSVSQFCAHHAPCPVVIMRGKPALCQPAGTGVRASSSQRLPRRPLGLHQRRGPGPGHRGVRGRGRVRHRPDRRAIPGPRSPRGHA